MENNVSNKTNTIVSLEVAINEIKLASDDNKLTTGKFIKIYDQCRKQKGIKLSDLTELITKGIEALPDCENEVLLQIYIKTKTKTSSNPYIQTFIRNKCIEKLNKIGYKISVENLNADFNTIISKGKNESESYRLFIKEACNKNEQAAKQKITSESILSVVYIFLAEMINDVYSDRNQKTKMLLIMERAFVEEILSLPNNDLKSFAGLIIPQYLDKSDVKKSLSAMSYLYYDYKTIAQTLSGNLSAKQTELSKLNTLVDDKNHTIDNLQSDINKLREENERLKSDLSKANAEKDKATNYLGYEVKRMEEQYRTYTEVLNEKYGRAMLLDVENIQDILYYIEDKRCKDAIQKHITRIKERLSEIKGEENG